LNVYDDDLAPDRVTNLEFLMEDLFMDEKIKMEHDKIRQAREMVKIEQQKRRELDGTVEVEPSPIEKRSALSDLRERTKTLEDENEFLRVSKMNLVLHFRNKWNDSITN
jgi:hypothetical protein